MPKKIDIETTIRDSDARISKLTPAERKSYEKFAHKLMNEGFAIYCAKLRIRSVFHVANEINHLIRDGWSFAIAADNALRVANHRKNIVKRFKTEIPFGKWLVREAKKLRNK